MPVDLTVSELVEGVRQGDRALLGQAITLVESTQPTHRSQARELLAALLPDYQAPLPEQAPLVEQTDSSQSDSGASSPTRESLEALRIGISGAPGVGKSTFIEALGGLLIEQGRQVAVLAVDPSSERTGGSIMGDKTRMIDLANNPLAFVRPSPTSGQLGGVHERTRETILLCEAAGYDIVLVETVGVGQSETAVADMVDFFLVLLLPGAGDELQGIKKGILELADMIAVNKADGSDIARAEQTAGNYRRALHLTASVSPTWSCPVVTCSAMAGDGLDSIWAEVERHHELFAQSGELVERRQAQRVRWLRALLTSELVSRLHAHPVVSKLLPKLEADVKTNLTTPTQAADELLEAFSKPS